MKQKTRLRPVWLLGLLAPALIIIGNQRLLAEWLDFAPTPPAPIAQLAQASAMTPAAARLFYRQQPTIESKETFLAQCKVPDKSIMLGCFIRRGPVGKIVIQAVTDPRLKGTMEVTAAHEMLHAAYEKLNQRERDDLGKRLHKAIARVTDARLKSVLKDYRAKDLNLYHNELHSHLGTELAQLGDAVLDKHYQRYFTDRQRLVALAERSGAVIKQLDDQADALKPQIVQLENELTQLEAQITRSETDLKASQEDLRQLEAELQTANIRAETAIQQSSSEANALAAQSNRLTDQFNRRVDQHNDLVRLQGNRIDNFKAEAQNYKQLINKYNKVARESRNILESLAHHP
jgi:predicted  nucleic acid-binding Zn-ribbon protein